MKNRLTRMLQVAGLVTDEQTSETPRPTSVDGAANSDPITFTDYDDTSKGHQVINDSVVLNADDSLKIDEGADVKHIYEEAAVVDGPYPIERLAKVLAGLSQMDVASRRVAIEAMDAADDTWSIEDVLADGRNKVNALTSYQNQVKELREAIRSEVENRITESQENKNLAVADIDKQISELQIKREEFLSTSATEVAQLRGQDLAAEDAATREVARIEDNIKQIKNILTLFSKNENNTPSNS